MAPADLSPTAAGEKEGTQRKPATNMRVHNLLTSAYTCTTKARDARESDRERERDKDMHRDDKIKREG